jgi:type I restriction enzyme S subunit
MTSDWREVTLGEVIELKRGYDLPRQIRTPGPVPIVSSGGILDYHNTVKVMPPGVVTGRYGTLGNVYFIQEPYWPLNTTLYVRDFKGNDPRFISYFLKSVDFLAYSDKAAVPGLNRNHLHQAIVRVPPLPEQRRIAHILGTLDDKIELNRRMNATLEAMARALFKSWFVDFDPVRAKAAGRDPRLPADIAALFPAALVESELGEVPEGWGVGQVGELFNVTMGQSPPGSTYNESAEGLPFYQGRADFDSRYPNRRVYCTAPTRFAQAGDSLVSVRAPVGSLNMAGEECAIGRGLAAVRHKSGSRSFTYYSMQSLESSFSLFEAEGTVFGSINKDAFAGLAAVAPPTAVVSAFESIAYPLDERILLNTQQASTLAALRDTLLPRLLSGAVRVPSVD